MNAGTAVSRWTEEKAQTKVLLGEIVMLWGDVMASVYRLPSAPGLANPEAIQLGLAHLNGDGTRFTYLSKLLRHNPKLADVDEQRIADTIAVLARLNKMNKQRDSFVHGLPVLTMKRDQDTRETIRDGCYLIQTRELDEKDRYLKVPEAAETFLTELQEVYDQLLQVTVPMLFEDWQQLWDDES